MRNFAILLQRFQRDERGVFLALFAVISLALIATSGAVVDFVGVQNARSEAQFALDAAALALQPRIYDTDEETLRSMAEDLVLERMSDSSVAVEVESANVTLVDGALFLEARVEVPLAFVGLVGVPQMTARVASEATRKKLFLEVAFVLDNSGSMGSYGRMTNLKQAAACATNIIFYGVCVPEDDATKAPNVAAAIVPFTSMVNVGASNSGAEWMDTTGVSSISNDNFDDDDNTSTPMGPVSRFDLYDEIDNVEWEGCVEARPYPYSVNDAEPDILTPDTLFVPMFAPDMPDTNGQGYDNNYLDDTPDSCGILIGSCTVTSVTTPGYWGWGCGWRGRYGYCSGSTTSTGVFTALPGYDGSPSSCSCGGDDGTCDVYFNAPESLLTDRVQQERICKYEGSTANLSGHYGPNSDCPAREILPLTESPAALLSDISDMVARGATNIHQGVIWGYHVLSPTEPFVEGDDYDNAVSKVMIVMTDGENTYYGNNNMNGSDFTQAYGHLYNAPITGGNAYELNGGRLGYSVNDDWQMPTIMNTLTGETCENAKAEGIEIYTIGLEPPDETLENLLIACSSGSGYYYFPESSSELTAVFTDIANQLAALRLAL